MAIPIHAKEERRAWKRYIVLLKGKYLLDNFRHYKECIVIDISRQGACIKTPIEDNVSRGDAICLKLVNDKESCLKINAEVQWTKTIEHGSLIGIKFESPFDIQATKIL